MKELTVFGGLSLIHVNHRMKQIRVIVAAPSRAAAHRAVVAAGINVTIGEMRTYWGETGNKIELNVAGSAPGVVFYATDRLEQIFTPYVKPA